ncbi:hypothetical protein NQ314_018180 [Rhamnusium bicolor]|uniref:ZAD domain-containing protein n=1 Tax=Rhamnusium bicolor TaxID=1586634 RepID=A0AAV8WTQ8_9CUCU|nr:hypothetical protein NQ314_018180 [Rhamnusium bicolor]
MADEKLPVCRLCLEIVYDGRFENVDTIIIILQNVLPDLDFNLSSRPVICNKCVETLQKSFSFKSVCLETEKYLQNNRSSGSSTLYLEEVVCNKMSGNGVKMEKIDKENICRFCLQIIEGELSTQLGVLEEDMLGKCVPELDLTLSENPVVCEICLEKLQRQFIFVMSCLDVEDRIKNYCFLEGRNGLGQVNLHDILVLSLEMQVDKNDQHSDCNELKTSDSTNQAANNIKIEDVFIKDEVCDETMQDNLGVSDENVSSRYNMVKNEFGTEILPHELDHDYLTVLPSHNKGLLYQSSLSRKYKMKHFIRPRKEVRTLRAFKRTILELEKKIEIL